MKGPAFPPSRYASKTNPDGQATIAQHLINAPSCTSSRRVDSTSSFRWCTQHRDRSGPKSLRDTTSPDYVKELKASSREDRFRISFSSEKAHRSVSKEKCLVKYSCGLFRQSPVGSDEEIDEFFKMAIPCITT